MLLGTGEFLPNKEIYTWAGQKFCRDEVPTQIICSSILFLTGGWNVEQLNTVCNKKIKMGCLKNISHRRMIITAKFDFLLLQTILPIIFGHMPGGASIRQLAHYGQGISGKDFRRYDYGNWISNMRAYGSIRPPHYDVSKITAPVFLHYADHDQFAHVNDVDRLFRELGRPIGKFRVPLSTFSHLDFMWAIDVKELLYDRVINFIGAMEANTKDQAVY